MRALKLGFRLALCFFGALMAIGIVGAGLHQAGAPLWIALPLMWALRIATLPGQLVVPLFPGSSPGPAWIAFSGIGAFLGASLLGWTLLASAGLWLWRFQALRARPRRECVSCTLV